MRCRAAASARACSRRSPTSRGPTASDGSTPYVLANNDRMMRVFVDSGFAIEQQLEAGVFHVVLDLDRTAGFEARAAARSETAATASVQAFLAPRSVAVIGASRERGKIGSEILHNLVSAGFTGRLFVVHPSAAEIDGVPAVRRLDEIPGDVDLAVICVPASQVSGVVDDCIAKRVRALVDHQRGIRRNRRRGPSPRGRDRRAHSRGRHPAGRPELHGRAQHRRRPCG